MADPFDPNMPKVGDRIKIVVAPHADGQDEGIVRQVVDGALGIEFDGMPGMVHHWYVPSEVMVLGQQDDGGMDENMKTRASGARHTHVVRGIAAEAWAIIPSELQKIAAIVGRHQLPDASQETPAYVKRDYELMAGPGAQRLAGTTRTFVIDGVAIMPITGPIFPRANLMTEFSGATSVSVLGDDYRRALAADEVGAILFLIDSPGGAVSGIQAFADLVASGTKKKPTVAYVAGTAASAAYWIASAAGEIAIDRTGIVGSIGVVAGVPVQVAPDGNGEMWLEIVSSNAPNKRPDPMSEEGLAEIVSTLDALEKLFVADVAKGRNTTAAKVKAEFGAGGVKVGADAVAVGMADKVQSYDATLTALRRQVANTRKLASVKR